MTHLSFAGMAVLAGVLQGAIQEQVTDLIASVSPIEAAMIGGSGVASVGVVRWLVKRAAPVWGSPAGTTVSTTATNASTGGGNKHSVAFTVPGIVPLSAGIRKVTHNEIHAIELGLVVGLVLAWLYDAGHTEPVLGILVAFVAGSLGYKRYSTKAFKTIRLEPWYALLALAAGGGLGWAIFTKDPG